MFYQSGTRNFNAYTNGAGKTYCISIIEVMISVEKCKQILSKNGEEYTTEKLTVIREALYNLARLDYSLFTEKNKENKENIDLPIEIE